MGPHHVDHPMLSTSYFTSTSFSSSRVAVARVYIERLRSSFEMEHRLRSEVEERKGTAVHITWWWETYAEE